MGEGANRTRGGVAMSEAAPLTAPPRGVNAAAPHPWYAWCDVRPMAVLAAAAALVLGATVPYVRSRTEANAGHCLGWPAGTLTFHENVAGAPGTGDAGFTAMETALGTWAQQMGACGNLTLVMGSRTQSRTVGFDDAKTATNENILLFRTRLCSEVVPATDPCVVDSSCSNVYDCWDSAPGTLAITTTTFNSRTGKMYDADLEMNATVHTFTTVDSPPCTELGESDCVSTDIQNTVTHEFGHALGLAHSPDPRSTMYAGSVLGETSKRVLDDGSQEFVCTAYPAGQPTRDCDGSPLDLSDQGPSSCGAAPLGPLGLLVALLGLRRRRGNG